MKDHPLTPMTDANLVRVLQRQTTRKVGLVRQDTVAAGAQATSVSFKVLVPFDHNGVFHLIQMVGLAILGIGLRMSMQPEPQAAIKPRLARPPVEPGPRPGSAIRRRSGRR